MVKSDRSRLQGDNVFGDGTTDTDTSVLSGWATQSFARLFDGSTDADAQVTVAANGAYSVASAALGDGTITSLPSSTDPSGASTSAAGNAVSTDTDSGLNPTLSVNAANPADVIFTVSGLESDYSGTVTFTDSTGKSDVVPIGSDGTYSANLSNLASGTLTYLMTVTDPTGNVINVDPTATLGDGSANAPAGPPQDPNLLNGYAVRPPWEVAGVDYAVGIPAGTTLKDPSTISMSGVSVNTSTHIITVTGNNVTLSGYDFSLNGGWGIQINGASNTVIENSNFLVGSNNNIPIQTNSTASNLTVLNNTMDGGGTTSNGNSNDISALIYYQGTGTFVAEYNLLQNTPEDAIDFVGSAGSLSPTVEFNLSQNLGTQSGAHPDFVQFTGGTINNAVISYNTIYAPPTQTEGAEGIQIDAQLGGTITNTSVTNNTILAPMGAASGDTMSFLIAIQNQDGTAGTNNIGNIANNYVVFTGAWGTFYPLSGTTPSPTNWTFSNNVDMTTGKIVQANNSEVASTSTSVTKVLSSPSSGIETPGNTITLTVDFSAAVTVSGTPTLSLNDGGTASYTGGSGTSALTFKYTVGASDSAESALAITQVNQPNGATIRDANGNTPSFAGALTTFPGLQIGALSGPTLNSITESPSSGDLNAGKTVTLTLNMSANVTVNTTDGTPTLTLNDGTTATYASGSGTSALVFTYTVAAGQNTAALAATAVNLNGASITDGSGNAATNLSLSGLTQTGPQIDTSAPAAPIMVAENIVGNRVVLTGTAVAGDIVSIYDGTTPLGTTSSNSTGNWVFVTPSETDGTHTFTATATDTAGNVSALSNAIDPDIGAAPAANAAAVEVGNQYYLYNSSGSDVALTYAGAVVTAGKFGGWTPIAAVQTATGYDVAWKMTGANEYTVWVTNSSGNAIANLTGPVSGTSYALESLESTFNQDLNGDGVIGLTTTVIQVDGSTSLTEVANRFYLDGIGGSGPALQYTGADVTAGEFGGWTPIGAVQTATGYDVAWKMTGANEYTVWATNSSGNAIANLTGPVSGTSTALELLESTFNQDLNGDGVIGLYAAPGTTLQINTAISGSATIGAGATLELAAADSGSVTFASSKGMLILNNPSTFSGEIFNFAGNGSLSGSDQIDLTDINFNSVQYSYANGVLTVTDGTDTSTLDFNGSYSLASFKLASDGSGGTIVYDPPVPNFGAASGTSAGSGSSLVTGPPPTDPQSPAGFGSTASADAPPVDPQNFSGFGRTVGTDTPAADPQSSTGYSSLPMTDTTSLGMHNAHGFGGSTVIDPPLVGAANQSNVSGSPSDSDPTVFGTIPVTEPPPVALQNTADFGSPPASNPPPISPQNPTGFGFLPVTDPQNGSNGLSMPAFGAATTLGYFTDGNAESTVLATNSAQGPSVTLLANYMASSFTTVSNSNGGTMVVPETSPAANQSLLTNPHHM